MQSHAYEVKKTWTKAPSLDILPLLEETHIKWLFRCESMNKSVS